MVMKQSRAMRVLHVNLSPGGLGRYGALFADALARRSDVEVLSVFEPGLLRSEPIKHIREDLPRVEVPFLTMDQRLKAIPRLRKILRRWKPDIVHDTAGSGLALGAIVLAVVARNVPWVVTEHDPVPHLGMGTSFHSRLARWLIRHRAAHIFVHGPQCKEHLLSQGVDSSKVSVIYHGELGSFFNQISCAKDVKREEKTVLFFGELRPNKGVELLIPIADKIHDQFPDVKFIVAGSPEVSRDLKKSGWETKLQAILREMRSRPYFEVHDRFIPDKEVAGFFQRASITLLPYLDATQSGVAMVAMPLGSVVVATRVGDLPYVIQDGKTGFLAEANVEGIVQKLTYALSHPQQMTRVRDNAAAYAKERCAWGMVADNVVKVYFQFQNVSARSRYEKQEMK